MILSKQHQFVFIKGRKVAGTSLELLLSDVCGPKDIITPITPIDEQHRLLHGMRTAQNCGFSAEESEAYFEKLRKLPKGELGKLTKPKSSYYAHMPYREVVDHFGDIPDYWTTFAVERCPYRKIISLSNFRLNVKEYKRSGQAMVSSIANLKAQIARDIQDESIKAVRNIDLYQDRDGSLRTRILRYENLGEEVERLMSELGIEGYPELPHLKRGMLSNRMELHALFSAEQLRTINTIFEEEFRSFGYEMIE